MKIAVLCKLFFWPENIHAESYFRKMSLPNVTGTTFTPIDQRVALYHSIENGKFDWKCKLWTGIAQALFDWQPCNFCPHMRLLMPNNFATLTFDLWPLDCPPFWIKWITLKIDILLGFSRKVHETLYTWTLDLYR